LLQELVGTSDPSCCIHFSDYGVGSGADLFLAADQMRLGDFFKADHNPLSEWSHEGLAEGQMIL
jgi:hypothetical protein